ncbi:MAG: DUF1285 domain-containing protein [Halioglobus sp.]
MKDRFESLAGQVQSRRDFDSPPLHLWHPPLSGDMAIRIDAQGKWYHEGREIKRESLVRLFASILRRERDGEYYLVTPSEKWRISVEWYPLLVIDFDVLEPTRAHLLQGTLNTGRKVIVSELQPLFLDADAGSIAVMTLPHGLSAICTRPAWYRLVAMASHQDGVTAPGVRRISACTFGFVAVALIHH